jgi:CheY-like chemotaxis protein
MCEFAEIELYQYDCILPDLMLAGGDRLKIFKELKSQNKQDGVIITSANYSLTDKIAGLQVGAEYDVVKLFHLSELFARIYAVIRRKQCGNTNIVRLNKLQIDLMAKTIPVNDEPDMKKKPIEAGYLNYLKTINGTGYKYALKPLMKSILHVCTILSDMHIQIYCLTVDSLGRPNTTNFLSPFLFYRLLCLEIPTCGV